MFGWITGPAATLGGRGVGGGGFRVCLVRAVGTGGGGGGGGGVGLVVTAASAAAFFAVSAVSCSISRSNLANSSSRSSSPSPFDMLFQPIAQLVAGSEIVCYGASIACGGRVRGWQVGTGRGDR